MVKILCAPSIGLSVRNLAQFALKICLAAQNRQKIHKNPFFRSASFKVIEFGGN